MKKIFLLLSTMIPLLCTSQVTDISLSENQQIEVYKGLRQGENFKEVILDKDNQIKELEQQIKKDSDLIRSLLQKIENLESVNRNNKMYIEHQEREIDLKIKKEKNKRFGVGFVSGYGITPEFKNNAFVGLGLSYSIFRF